MAILDVLEQRKIFGVTLSRDKKTAKFEELCDMYYTVKLNKAEMLELAEEIKIFAGYMEE